MVRRSILLAAAGLLVAPHMAFAWHGGGGGGWGGWRGFGGPRGFIAMPYSGGYYPQYPYAYPYYYAPPMVYMAPPVYYAQPTSLTIARPPVQPPKKKRKK